MKPIRELHIVNRLSIGVLALASLAFAQDQTARPWRAATDPEPAGAIAAQGGPDQAPNPAPAQSNQGYAVDQQAPPPALAPDPQGQPGPQLPTNYGPPNLGVPPQLTIKQ